MSTLAVNVHRKVDSLDIHADLDRARRLATLLDAQFEFAGIKFGFDAIIGLVPVVGDTIALLAGLYPIHVARKHGLGRVVEMRMWANLAIDYFGGLIPIVGDMFDVTYKANLKNVSLLEAAISKRS
ncbi:MAG TPA: DUF4112 domain-containing protein [Tepidisphaeraceae bacterium]|jgi:hypothetical protein